MLKGLNNMKIYNFIAVIIFGLSGGTLHATDTEPFDPSGPPTKRMRCSEYVSSTFWRLPDDVHGKIFQLVKDIDTFRSYRLACRKFAQLSHLRNRERSSVKNAVARARGDSTDDITGNIPVALSMSEKLKIPVLISATAFQMAHVLEAVRNAEYHFPFGLALTFLMNEEENQDLFLRDINGRLLNSHEYLYQTKYTNGIVGELGTLTAMYRELKMVSDLRMVRFVATPQQMDPHIFCRSFENLSMFDALKEHPNLERLDILRYRVTYHGLLEGVERSIGEFCQHHPNLKVLQINMSGVSMDGETLARERYTQEKHIFEGSVPENILCVFAKNPHAGKNVAEAAAEILSRLSS